MGQTTGSSNSFQLRERAVLNSDLLGTSGNWTALANGLGNNQPGYASGTQYTFTMTLTRNAANGLDIVSSMTGGTIGGGGVATVSFTDPTPSSFVYDTFALRPSAAASTADSFDTTLFKVETTTAVPEPTSAALLCLGAFALVRRRAR